MNCAVVLAAGSSERMGRAKVLLSFAGKTVIGHIVDQIASSVVDRIYVVVGSEGERIREAVSGHEVTVVRNPDHHEGMLSSVRCGLHALPRAATAVLVVLGDQPRITPSVVDALFSALSISGKGIVVPVHQGHRGHPLVFRSRYIPEVLDRYDPVGLRGLLAAHPDDIAEVDVPEDSVLSDMDTPADYEREWSRHLGHGDGTDGARPRAES